MSAGGVFKLIANDGKADRMIMATELLNQRIRDIMCMRAKQGLADPTPTLVDVERTHILFVNAHFKPFAALGYEYNKVTSQSGNIAFGGTALFSIPQFGDFFYDMVVHSQLAPVSATKTGTLPKMLVSSVPQVYNSANSGAPVTTTTDVIYPDTRRYHTYYGVKTPGVVIAADHDVMKITEEYVYADGSVIPLLTAHQPFVRYCEYPGQRLHKRVKFNVNGNPLDEYTDVAYMYYQKFHVAPGKQVGWKRLTGQEVPVTGYSDLKTITAVNQYQTAATAFADVSGIAIVGAPRVPTTNTRQSVSLLNGPQTAKEIQPTLDLWTPLIFWFNRDSRLAIPSISIPYGQRFIDITVADQNEIVYQAPGNTFKRVVYEQWTATATFAAGISSISSTGLQNYRRTVHTEAVLPTGATLNAQVINKMDLYINNIFVNPEIHDIYIKRIGFSLIRVHRFQTETVSADGHLWFDCCSCYSSCIYSY
jgi:hypothetical protein